MHRLLAASAIVTVLVTAACSGDDADGGSGDTASTVGSEAPSTTVDPLVAATEYAEAGPYPVGVVKLQLAKGPLVEVGTRRPSRSPAPSATTCATTRPRRSGPC